MRPKNLLRFALGLIFLGNFALAQLKKAPASQVPQAIIQACVFEKRISAKDEISIFVMGDGEIAKTLEMYEKQKLGNSILANVGVGQKAPSDKPTILILGDPDLVGQATAYCQENSVLSITNIPDMVKEGISLGIGVDEAGSLKLIINPRASAKEGNNWNLAIMKLAKIIQ